MRNLILLSLVLFQMNLIGQNSIVNFQDNNFIKRNIIDRGYQEPRLLFNNDEVAYYWVKSMNRERKNDPSKHQEIYPLLIAIHNVSKAEQLFESKVLESGFYGETKYELKNPEEIKQFLKSNVFNSLPSWYFMKINFYAANLHLEKKKNIETPLIKLSFYREEFKKEKWNEVLFDTGGRIKLEGCSYQNANDYRNKIDSRVSDFNKYVQKEKILLDNGITKNIYSNPNYKLILSDVKRLIDFYLYVGENRTAGMAGVIAIHNKEENKPLFEYKERFKKTYQLNNNEKEYLVTSLFPEIKKFTPNLYNVAIYNFIKNVHLNNPERKIYYNLHNLYEGDILTLSFKYDDEKGWVENLYNQLTYNNSMTLKEAIKQREDVKSGLISKDKINFYSLERQIIKLQKIYGDFELVNDIKEKKAISEKYGYQFFEDDYWIEYDKDLDVPSNVIHIFKYIFNGNFKALTLRLNYVEEGDLTLMNIDNFNPEIYFIYIFEPFFWEYSARCKDFLPKNSITYSPVLKNVTENSSGQEIDSREIRDYGDIYLAPEVYEKFKAYFPRYINTFGSNKLKSYMDLFFSKYDCNCKEMNQLYKNLTNYANHKESLQTTHNIVLKGNKCE